MWRNHPSEHSDSRVPVELEVDFRKWLVMYAGTEGASSFEVVFSGSEAACKAYLKNNPINPDLLHMQRDFDVRDHIKTPYSTLSNAKEHGIFSGSGEYRIILPHHLMKGD